MKRANLDLHGSADAAFPVKVGKAVNRSQSTPVPDQYTDHVPRQDAVEPEGKCHRKLHQMFVLIGVPVTTAFDDLLWGEGYAKTSEGFYVFEKGRVRSASSETKLYQNP